MKFTEYIKKTTSFIKNSRFLASAQRGYLVLAIVVFIPIIAIFITFLLEYASQNNRDLLNQEMTQAAQLAGISAMDFAKEQYELNIDYSGTSETVLYENDRVRVTYEVVSKGYSNPTNTQQDIQGIGRVYRVGDTEPAIRRDIQGKITYTGGAPNAVRFIFIVDNSGSMSSLDFVQSKSTIDAAAEFVIDNAPDAEVAIVQHGSNNRSYQHTYDVTVPFTRDKSTAINWGRHYGRGSPNPSYYSSHLAASFAVMRQDDVFGPGEELDLSGATNVQFVIFTDAEGVRPSGCCSTVIRGSSDPDSWFPGLTVLDGFGEFNDLKDGTVFSEHGYDDLTSQMTILHVFRSGSTSYQNNSDGASAAVASTGGGWTGVVTANPGDPEGSGILPRKFISTSLAAGPEEILSLLQEILDREINI